jgi:hypothetical protein
MRISFPPTAKVTVAAVLVLITACTTSTKANAPDFYGFTVVNIKVDGKDIKGDVPAVNFYGRTVVPIRFVSEALGAKVEWNNDTNTATITSQNQSVPAATASQQSTQATVSQTKYNDDTSKLKLYSRISNAFMQINDLSKQVMNISNLFGDIIDNVDNDNVSSLFSNVQTSLNNLKNDLIPSTQKDISALKQAAAQQSIDISDMDTMFTSLNSALGTYTSASTIVSSYIITQDDSSLSTYQTSESAAFNAAKQVMDSSFAKFGEFYGKIQNF